MTIALFGAGGKMGCRLTDNFLSSDFDVMYVENGEAGVSNLALRCVKPTSKEVALERAEVVILALPDRILGSVAHDIVPKVQPGTIVMTLDPAAAYAGEFPERSDITYFVTHPCHPPIWNDEVGDARRDFFGGVKAKQAIVCALVSGPEEHYAKGEAVAKLMYGPVTRSHRITVEQMAILEPAMAETVTAMCCSIIKEALDEAISRGVPPEAARDFMMGHVNIPLAIVFGEAGNPFSDGAKLIIEYGKQKVIQPDWKQVFEPESVRDQVRAIVSGQLP